MTKVGGCVCFGLVHVLGTQTVPTVEIKLTANIKRAECSDEVPERIRNVGANRRTSEKWALQIRLSFWYDKIWDARDLLMHSNLSVSMP